MPQTPITYFPPMSPVDRDKVPPDVADHLEKMHTHFQLIFDRLQNHYSAVQNLQTQVNTLQAQVNKK